MNILGFIKKQYVKTRIKLSSEVDRADLIRKYYGVDIGENVRITGNIGWSSEPFLITIGNNVTITEGVMFVTHDGGVGLFREEYEGINVFAKIKVGNNVFIGMKSIILPGVTIGNNVVIGAGSVVAKDIPDGVVVAGVPARKIRSIHEYKESCLEKAVYVFSRNQGERKKEILKAVT